MHRGKVKDEMDSPVEEAGGAVSAIDFSGSLP
jgi:hypothetical protein